ncbi:alpha-glucan family phosphorylase [Rhodoflexus caldus]|uniref:alpha-glucan family phosphorylase n=1 Tax=Rhodoflexus caldus TaxID=2891236 RepID=UPI00202A8C7F|nr:alpha-glucan family phosphorylase [Rhodoflexus caldus]
MIHTLPEIAQYSHWRHPYTPDPKYNQRVAYFSMEFAIDQCLKTYAGGLGFLAGSHMRSAYDLRQNMVGIGILWKRGYYDQTRQENGHMNVLFQEKHYSFLEDTGIKVGLKITHAHVYVKAYCLRPETFGTVPIYFLTTDIPENDYLSRTITERLYDDNELTRVAQSMVLGIAGAKVLEALGGVDVYHMNEGHALPLAYYLYKQHHRNIEEVRKRLVFTTHTPEKAGNETHETHLMQVMNFFYGIDTDEAMRISGQEGSPVLDYTLAALHLSRKANAVSKLHGIVSNQMWGHDDDICPIISITNAQNKHYWADTELQKALENDDDRALIARKKQMKAELFRFVANQTGNLFSPDILTIVWARRFAGYKRADLILRDLGYFERILRDRNRPIQMIWAGKPYPGDSNAVNTFNYLVDLSRTLPNCAVLTGYELHLSRLLKNGADVWLNTPRRTREASGTSGMTAAMNGAINFSISDGWIPEFAIDGVNAFIIPPADLRCTNPEQDMIDHDNLMEILTRQIIPTYYNYPEQWLKIMKQSMRDVTPRFDSDRMADEYYRLMYQQ